MKLYNEKLQRIFKPQTITHLSQNVSFTKYFCLNLVCVVNVKWSKVWLYQCVVYTLVLFDSVSLSTLVWRVWVATKGTKKAQDVKKRFGMAIYIARLENVMRKKITPRTRRSNFSQFG